MKDKSPKISGTLKVKILDREGVILEEFEGKNLIVSSGYAIMAELLGGSENNAINRVAVGTNAAEPALTDDKITDPSYIKVSEVSYPRVGTVQFSFRVGYEDAPGKIIQEFGLITAGGRLFSRKTREPIEKTENMAIVGTWEINFLDI